MSLAALRNRKDAHLGELGPRERAAAYRHVLGHHPTGVVVITGRGELGMSCSSFFSVSLDPPLVGFCPARTSTTWPRIRATGSFCVNILAEDQALLAGQFSADSDRRFDGVSWRDGLTGSPILSDVTGWIECRVHSELEAGDHTVALGEVVSLEVVSERSPLVFCRRMYTRVHAA